MFKKILFPTDLSDLCDAPFRVALEIARKNDAGLYILHVLESRYSGKYRFFIQDMWSGEEIGVTGAYLDKIRTWIKDLYGLSMGGFKNYLIDVRIGFPYLEILRTARRQHIDLIVMAPHSGMAQERGTVRTFGKIKTTVQGVTNGATCAVLVVDGPSERTDLMQRLLSLSNLSVIDENAEDVAVEIAKELEGVARIDNISDLSPYMHYRPPAELHVH